MPYPPIAKDDLGVTAGRYAAALGEANTRLVKSAQCEAKVRAVFAKGGAP